MHGRAARRLVEEDLDVPAKRQEGAPDPGERPHRDHREADPGIAEGGGAHDSGEAQPERQLAHQELEQHAEALVGDNEKKGGDAHHHCIALERQPVEPVQDDQHDDHQQQEDAGERCHLPQQRDNRPPARAAQPGAEAAP